MNKERMKVMMNFRKRMNTRRATRHSARKAKSNNLARNANIFLLPPPFPGANLCGKNLKLYFMGNFFFRGNFFSWKKS